MATITPVMTIPVANVMADGTPDLVNRDQVYPALSANSDLLPAENLWQYSPPQTGMFAQTQMSPEPQFTSGQQPQQQSVVQGMFPEVDAMQRALYQQKQQEAMQAQAMQYAQLDPMARAQYSLYLGGQQLGGAIGGALGAKDPQLQLISQRNALMSQLDQSNPDTFFKTARMAYQLGDSDFATKIADAGQKLQVSLATARKITAEAQKFELSNTQEQKLREELSKLPANATEADVLGIVTKYGSPDKVLAVLQASTDKASQRELLVTQQKDKLEAQAEQARKDNEAKMERAKENNASKAELASIAAEGRAQQNAITNSIREQTLQIRQEAANEKKVAAQRQQQGVVSSFDTALDTLDVIAKHPGKKTAVGFGGAQLSMIPGTDAAGFAAQLETFKAQTFLPQVQALKGMGALSDAEGKKLTSAVGALTQSMKLDEFNSQIEKIKGYLQAARERTSSGMNTPIQQVQPSTGKTVKFSDLP